MLSEQIVNTIKFFDFQDLPLTAFEISRFLISDKDILAKHLDDHFELIEGFEIEPKVQPEVLLVQLENLVKTGDLGELNGFYCLPGREIILAQRLRNYRFDLLRERLIRRYAWGAKHVPFVRGVALAGSQAFGLPRKTSDIDLLVVADPEHMWTARVFLTIYFQIFGVRRYGKNITNRFCLNHYLSSIREMDTQRNLYTAIEYAKLRPLVYSPVIHAFQFANLRWINAFLPNFQVDEPIIEYSSNLQRYLEGIVIFFGGRWFENLLARLQLGRIKQDKFIFVKEDELSFHPNGKHESLLRGFFANI